MMTKSAIEYYLAIKKNELLPFVTTQLQLKGNMVSKVSQKVKQKYQMVSLICGIREQKARQNQTKSPRNLTIK